jgi:NADH-quinone oxidoreductase subunit I
VTSLVMRKEDLLVPTHGLPDAVASDKDEAEVLA